MKELSMSTGTRAQRSYLLYKRGITYWSILIITSKCRDFDSKEISYVKILDLTNWLISYNKSKILSDKLNEGKKYVLIHSCRLRSVKWRIPTDCSMIVVLQHSIDIIRVVNYTHDFTLKYLSFYCNVLLDHIHIFFMSISTTFIIVGGKSVFFHGKITQRNGDC